MTKYVTINLFDVDWTQQTHQTLSQTLDDYGAMPLDQRWRDDIRLDKVQARPDAPNRGLPARYMLDFSKRREVGPGKLGTSAPVQDIVLGQDEDFGEETAALYVPSKKWLVVLYNHAGIGPSRMVEYFNALDPGGNKHFDYRASPKLDPQAMARFGSMRNLLSVEVTATVDALATSGAAEGMAVAAATAGARKISFELRANSGRKKTNFLSMAAVRSMVNGLLAQDPDDVSILKVKGEDPKSGQQDQVIDLLEHKLKQKFPQQDLVVMQHRYTLDSRWMLLERALRFWL